LKKIDIFVGLFFFKEKTEYSMKSSKIQIVLGFVIFILFNFCSENSIEQSKPSFTVSRDSAILIVESGQIESQNNSFVFTPSSWHMTYRIIYIVPEGSYVQEADTVVRFDPSDALSRLDEAKSVLELKNEKLIETIEKNAIEYKQKQNQLKQLELQVAIDKNKLEQAKFESDVNRKEMELELEKSRLSLIKAQTELESQKILNQQNRDLVQLEINQANNRINRANFTISDMFLTAPKGGMVVYQKQGWPNQNEKIREGSTVSSRDPILAIPDLNNMQVLVKLNEVDRPHVKIGQKAQIKIEAFPDTVFTGTINQVSRIVNRQENANNLKTYDITIHIDSQENYRLKPGLSAEVNIFLNTVDQYYSIPSFCLFGEPADYFIKSPESGNIGVTVRQIRDGLAYIEGESLTEGLKIISNSEIPVF